MGKKQPLQLYFVKTGLPYAKESEQTTLPLCAQKQIQNPHVIQDTLVQFLGQEDPLEKGTAIHSSILVWRSPWPVQSMGCRESDMTKQLSPHFQRLKYKA